MLDIRDGLAEIIIVLYCTNILGHVSHVSDAGTQIDNLYEQAYNSAHWMAKMQWKSKKFTQGKNSKSVRDFCFLVEQLEGEKLQNECKKLLWKRGGIMCRTNAEIVTVLKCPINVALEQGIHACNTWKSVLNDCTKNHYLSQRGQKDKHIGTGGSSCPR